MRIAVTTPAGNVGSHVVCGVDPRRCASESSCPPSRQAVAGDSGLSRCSQGGSAEPRFRRRGHNWSGRPLLGRSVNGERGSACGLCPVYPQCCRGRHGEQHWSGGLPKQHRGRKAPWRRRSRRPRRDGLLSTDWSGRQVQAVHGPADLTWTEAVEIVSAAIDRPLTVQQISDDHMRAGMLESGMPEKFVDAIMGMSTGLRDGFVPEQARTIQTTTPATLGAWAYEVLRPLV